MNKFEPLRCIGDKHFAVQVKQQKGEKHWYASIYEIPSGNLNCRAETIHFQYFSFDSEEEARVTVEKEWESLRKKFENST